MLLTLARTQNKADRRGLSLHLLMLFQVAQVELHLAFLGGFKFADLQIDGDEPAQAAVVKQQVNVVVAVVDGDAFLARHEGKVVAQLDDEALQFGQDGGLEVFL